MNDNPRVALDTRIRIREIAKRLNYSPNAMARGLVSRRSAVVGLVIPSVRNPYFARVAESVERAVRAAGYNLLIATTDEDPQREREALRLLIGHRVEGLIVTSCSPGGAEFAGLPRDFPLVLLGRRIDGVGTDFLAVDHEHGAHEAVAHLLNGGYRRIALVTGPLQLSDARSRVEGYRRALAARGIAVDESLIVEGDFSDHSGQRAINLLLDRDPRPDAVFISNILMLQGALRVLNQRAIVVPDELAVIANDRSDWAELLRVPTTTVEQPTDSMGSIAAEMLLRRIGNRGHVREAVELKPTLVIRDSSRPAARRAESQGLLAQAAEPHPHSLRD
jgi:LacI family transcriptional regulator